MKFYSKVFIFLFYLFLSPCCHPPPFSPFLLPASPVIPPLPFYLLLLPSPSLFPFPSTSFSSFPSIKTNKLFFLTMKTEIAHRKAWCQEKENFIFLQIISVFSPKYSITKPRFASPLSLPPLSVYTWLLTSFLFLPASLPPFPLLFLQI